MYSKIHSRLDWFFQYIGEPEEDFVVDLYGDVNFDNSLDITDVITMVNFVLGQPRTEEEELTADMNQDGILNILDVIQLSAEALSEIRGRPPKVVVCGLNPHAGEAGLFGEGEEDSIIRPAVDAARRAGRGEHDAARPKYSDRCGPDGRHIRDIPLRYRYRRRRGAHDGGRRPTLGLERLRRRGRRRA